MHFKTTLILLFISFLSFSQIKKYDANLDILSTTKGVFLYPSLGLKLNNKAILKIGPLLGQEYANVNTVFGVQSDFLFFPNNNSQKEFNLFFISSLNYFHDTVSLNFSEVSSNNIQLTFGYGFNYFLSKKTTLQTHMGIGTLVSFRNFNFNTTDPTTQGNFAGIISLGLNYKI